MNSIPISNKQSGAVLLGLVMILILGSSYMFLARFNANAQKAREYEDTIYALQQAKQALISYAVMYYDLYSSGDFGILPCPDRSTSGEEGNQDPTCGIRHVNSLGMLPWQTLDISPLYDGNGQCLWYVVSGAYKGGSTKPFMVNEDTHGTFQIIAADGSTVLAGDTPGERPVAVIFAPGRSINNQNRIPADGYEICGGNYTASNFLDAEVPDEPTSGIRNYNLSVPADSVDQFILTDNPESEDFNDLMVYITADELFDAIKKRNDYVDKLYDQSDVNNLTQRVAMCLANYAATHSTSGNYSMPWPTPLTLSDYRDSDNYDDVSDSDNLLSGRVPNVINDSNTKISDSSPAPVLFAKVNTGDTVFCKDFNGLSDAGDTLTIAEEEELQTLWNNWKDHLYYAVAESYQPIASATPACNQGQHCITINEGYPNPGNRDYAAVVIFSNSQVTSQSRNAPPIDADEKAILTNYLEGANNPVNYTDTAGNDTKQYDYQNSSSLNDVVYCINDEDGGTPPTLQVTLCPTTTS